MPSYFSFILLFLIILSISAGCVREQDSSQKVSVSDLHTPVVAANQSQTKEVIVNQTVVSTGNAVPEQTVIRPVETLTQPVPTSLPVTVQPDPVIVFRDQTILMLDDLQAKKDAVLRSYHTNNIIQVKMRAEEYAVAIRRGSTLAKVPSKMDYIRVSYYDYVDRAGQCAQSFTEGADRWLVNDKNSAKSYFDAGIIASDRADIADKRMRTFFRDYVHQVQTNLS